MGSTIAFFAVFALLAVAPGTGQAQGPPPCPHPDAAQLGAPNGDGSA